jgi:hypothetical protein
MIGELETTETGVDDFYDVEESDIEVATGSGLSPRDEKLNALMAQFEEDKEPEESEEVIVEALAPEPKKSRVYAREDGAEAIMLKVNGVEVERDLDSAIKDFQKYESADARLREAADARKNLEDYEHRLRVEAQALEFERAQRKQPEQDANSDDDYKALLESIYKGDDDAVDRLKRIMQPRPQAPVDNNELIRQAAAQASVAVSEQIKAQHFNDSVQRGKDWLYETYPDDIADSDIYNFINVKSGTISKDHPDMSPEAVIKQATTEVLGKMGRIKADAAPATTRAENKAALPKALPRQEATRRQVIEDEVDESPQAVGARMMRDRAAIRNSHY